MATASGSGAAAVAAPAMNTRSQKAAAGASRAAPRLPDWREHAARVAVAEAEAAASSGGLAFDHTGIVAGDPLVVRPAPALLVEVADRSTGRRRSRSLDRADVGA